MQSKIKKPHDVLAGLLFLAIGVAVAWYSSHYSLGTMRRMGPGFFPVMLGVLLSAIAVLIIIRGLVGQIEEMKPISARSLRIAFTVLLAMLVFGVLIRPAGLIIAILAMVLLSATAMRGYGFKAALLTGSILAAGSAIVFVVLLGQPLPLFGQFFG